MGLIKIGTLVDGFSVLKWIPKLIENKFECFVLNYWENTGDTDFSELSKKVKDALGDSGITVSTLSVYTNALRDENRIKEWEKCIDNAHLFGADIVTGFTGRLDDKSVPDNIPKFKEVFTELAKRAKDKGVRLAFENCAMGGDWNHGSFNIANSPIAWDMMFDAVPYDNIGIEWEPAHHLSYLRDPLISLKKYAKKIYHIHGKDANIDWEYIKEFGTGGPGWYASDRMPGYGDTNWKEVCTVLYKNGYAGTIDIEGFHDPYFRGESEFTGQVAALKYLKGCRGGEFVANP
ncbi:MAG: sugar phosphate isomerase/epimerase [Oscillospiraceae bacterium]|nr:sugar phosphate isomerase/epimerase [Oscillospiraceae bacterium]